MLITICAADNILYKSAVKQTSVKYCNTLFLLQASSWQQAFTMQKPREET